VGWDKKKRSDTVDHWLGQLDVLQRKQIRKALKRDPLAYLTEQGVKSVRPQLDVWRELHDPCNPEHGRRKTICIPWGRGVGKSFFLRLITYVLVAIFDGKKATPESPQTGIRILWFMDTFKHWTDVHADLMVSELEGSWSFLGVRRGRDAGIDGTSYKVRFPGGSTIKPFPALEHTAKTARGQRADVVLIDECDDVPEHIFWSVIGPIFSEPWSYKLQVVGGTPRLGKHGLLYHLHEAGLSGEPADRSYYSFHATYRDAPEIVDAETVARQKARMPPAIFAREWECKFDNPEGLVYDNWDPEFHVRELPGGMAAWRMVYAAADHGYVNPGCFLLGVLTGKQDDEGEDTRRLWIVDEIYETGKLPDWWADRAREWKETEYVTTSGMSLQPVAHAQWFADPAEPKTIEQLRQKAGIKIQKGLNAVLPGIRQVANLLNVYGSKDEGGDTRWARLYVSPKCVNLIREFGTYRRAKDPRDPDRYLEEIDPKQSDHAVDTCRYLVAGIFGLGNRRRRVVQETSYG
jgi:hypothetical protein